VISRPVLLYLGISHVTIRNVVKLLWGWVHNGFALMMIDELDGKTDRLFTSTSRANFHHRQLFCFASEDGAELCAAVLQGQFVYLLFIQLGAERK